MYGTMLVHCLYLAVSIHKWESDNGRMRTREHHHGMHQANLNIECGFMPDWPALFSFVSMASRAITLTFVLLEILVLRASILISLHE